jgi:hypothetical protein
VNNNDNKNDDRDFDGEKERPIIQGNLGMGTYFGFEKTNVRVTILGQTEDHYIIGFIGLGYVFLSIHKENGSIEYATDLGTDPGIPGAKTWRVTPTFTIKTGVVDGHPTVHEFRFASEGNNGIHETISGKRITTHIEPPVLFTPYPKPWNGLEYVYTDTSTPEPNDTVWYMFAAYGEYSGNVLTFVRYCYPGYTLDKMGEAAAMLLPYDLLVYSSLIHGTPQETVTIDTVFKGKVEVTKYTDSRTSGGYVNYTAYYWIDEAEKIQYKSEYHWFDSSGKLTSKQTQTLTDKW